MESVGSSRTSHFGMGHLRSLDGFKFVRENLRAMGPPLGWLVNKAPGFHLGHFLTNVIGTISDLSDLYTCTSDETSYKS